jgi:hypothetical protein
MERHGTHRVPRTVGFVDQVGISLRDSTGEGSPAPLRECRPSADSRGAKWRNLVLPLPLPHFYYSTTTRLRSLSREEVLRSRRGFDRYYRGCRKLLSERDSRVTPSCQNRRECSSGRHSLNGTRVSSVQLPTAITTMTVTTALSRNRAIWPAVCEGLCVVTRCNSLYHTSTKTLHPATQWATMCAPSSWRHTDAVV